MDQNEWRRRLSIILVLSGLFLLSITGRLFQKAIAEHEQISQEAQTQYTYRQEVQGQRGDIVVKEDDGSYYPLATNERRYQVLVVPHNVAANQKQSTADKLAPLVGMTSTDLYNAINNDKLYIPPLIHRLTQDQADKIANLKLTGVVILPEYIRAYTEQTLAAQTLGFVNAEGNGSYGIEGQYDDVLKGTSGYQSGQKDNAGNVLQSDTSNGSLNGAQIVLTINREIQYYAEQTLAAAVKDFEADSGSVIIMNPKTGAILTMASVPTYDPNQYNLVPQDQQSVFGNPVVSSVFEPGSIMKPIVMSLAIDKGLVQPDTQSTFAAFVTVLGHQIWTAEHKAFGLETMTQVLENSDNVGMVWVADKLGNQAEFDGLKKYGFSTPPDLQLSNVISGYTPPVKDWNDLTRATLSFGQGISVTPLQITMAYAAIANKGVMMKPYVVDQVVDDKGTLTTTKPQAIGQIVSADTAQKVSLMLQSVVDNGLGKRAAYPGVTIGGKTGTAQVPDPQGGYYDDRHIGSFAGFFPVSDPQYVMLVKIDNPKKTNFAESSAAPTFGKIAAWIIQHEQIKPDR